MNIGLEIISTALTEGNIAVVLDAGLNLKWLTGIGTGSEVIFTGDDRNAFQFILNHYRRHHRVPAPEIFFENYPNYRIKEEVLSLDELVELATDKVNSYLVADLVGKTIDLHDQGQIERAIQLLKTESDKLGTDIRYRQAKADNLSDPTFNIDDFLNQSLDFGVPMGIDPVDDRFYGFQAGQLISLMGRQKAGKTTLTLNSALSAWKEGYTVLFFSVEMDLNLLRQRLYCLGSHVSPSRMLRGHLRDSERQKVKDFHHQLVSVDGEEEGRFFLSKKKSLITLDDIYAEAAQYDPNVIYIDGFNFMVDRRSGKLANDWQANEVIADELKTLALEEGRTIFVNTQVREKQYHRKYGIEASAIAAGSGLLQASDLVMGADKDSETNQRTLNCVLSRFEEFDDVVFDIDWDTMNFVLMERPDLAERGI